MTDVDVAEISLSTEVDAPRTSGFAKFVRWFLVLLFLGLVAMVAALWYRPAWLSWVLPPLTAVQTTAQTQPSDVPTDSITLPNEVPSRPSVQEETEVFFPADPVVEISQGTESATFRDESTLAEVVEDELFDVQAGESADPAAPINLYVNYEREQQLAVAHDLLSSHLRSLTHEFRLHIVSDLGNLPPRVKQSEEVETTESNDGFWQSLVRIKELDESQFHARSNQPNTLLLMMSSLDRIDYYAIASDPARLSEELEILEGLYQTQAHIEVNGIRDYKSMLSQLKRAVADLEARVELPE